MIFLKVLKVLNDFVGCWSTKRESRPEMERLFFIKSTATISGSRGWLWLPYGLRP